MKFINLTPHQITIISRSDVSYSSTLRKYIAFSGYVPVREIPSSGVVSATVNTEDSDVINGIPVFKKTIVGFDELPEHDPSDIFIVSTLYAAAYKKAHPDSKEKLYTVSDLVYGAGGRTVLGCIGVCEVM